AFAPPDVEIDAAQVLFARHHARWRDIGHHLRGWRIDTNNGGTHVAQQHRAAGAGKLLSQIENNHTFKRSSHHPFLAPIRDLRIATSPPRHVVIVGNYNRIWNVRIADHGRSDRMRYLAGHGQVDAGRLGRSEGPPDRGSDIFDSGDPLAARAEAARGNVVVAVGEPAHYACFVPVDRLLTVNRHAPAGIVHYDSHDRKFMPGHSLELLEMEAECSVPHQKHHATGGVSHLRTYCDPKPDSKEPQVTSKPDDSLWPGLVG